MMLNSSQQPLRFPLTELEAWLPPYPRLETLILRFPHYRGPSYRGSGTRGEPCKLLALACGRAGPWPGSFDKRAEPGVPAGGASYHEAYSCQCCYSRR